MIRFKIERSIVMASVDEAFVESGEDACDALVNAVTQAVGTDVEVTAGGVTMILAAWADPEHWSSDWAEKGIDDPRAFIASLNQGVIR